MRRNVVITHTLKANQIWYQDLSDRYDFISIPFVQYKTRSQERSTKLSSSYQNIIISSPMSMQWYLKHENCASYTDKTLYFVGKNTADLYKLENAKNSGQIVYSKKIICTIFCSYTSLRKKGHRFLLCGWDRLLA